MHIGGRVSVSGALVGGLILLGATLVTVSLTNNFGPEGGPPQAPAASVSVSTTSGSGSIAGSVTVTDRHDRSGPPADSAAPSTPGPSRGSDPSAGAAFRSSNSAATDAAQTSTSTTSFTTHIESPPSATASSPVATAIRGPVLASSPPIAIDIPRIEAHSELLTLGLNDDGTVEVPPLDVPESPAGWYRYSPTPGELGPAVILGHVDSKEYGPGVFYRLGELVPGDRISVTRADGPVATFVVDRTVRNPKDDFPTDEVYGDIDHAGLRLITCGGVFDPEAGSYHDNTVVYASLMTPP